MSPLHGGWRFSRSGSGLRLHIERFHCTGWPQYWKDHTFVQVGAVGSAAEKLRMKDAENVRDLTFVGLFWIELHKTSLPAPAGPPMVLPAPVPAPRALPLPRPAEWLALPPADAPPQAETLALALPPPAELHPEDWEWEVLEAAARDEELAQQLMEEEGWVLAEPSAPFIPGVYQ